MGFTFEYVDEDQLLKTHSKQVSKVKEYLHLHHVHKKYSIQIVYDNP